MRGSPIFNPNRFQSTPPAWGATETNAQVLREDQVSIHAPRVGGDPRQRNFLSGHICFNPRPPRGGRRPRPMPVDLTMMVSIHAPRVGGDGIRCLP